MFKKANFKKNIACLSLLFSLFLLFVLVLLMKKSLTLMQILSW